MPPVTTVEALHTCQATIFTTSVISSVSLPIVTSSTTPTLSSSTALAIGSTLTTTCSGSSSVQTSVSSRKRPRHSLLEAGFIPEEMADILEIPQSNEASSRKRTKRITGARDLTAEDYRNMLLADKKKKEELEEEKKMKKEERERKK